MNPDRELVDAVLSNARGAFERLVREHQELVWHIVYRIVRHPEDTRDLCQETFLRVHQHLRQYRYESRLKTWIGRVAYMVALRHMERLRLPIVEPARDDDAESLVESVDDGFDLEAAWADADERRRLFAAIDALPPLLRTLLTLYHLDELPIPEISTITGLAAGTIKSHLFRTRAKLRAVLEGVAA
ncbi:MAG TPA: RNA polymerase sigma factor [Rhodanobacteraceae bacterium]|nr:RNA polymerase sigma factor [Rhodanobacteraceae bacterium]